MDGRVPRQWGVFDRRAQVKRALRQCVPETAFSCDPWHLLHLGAKTSMVQSFNVHSISTYNTSGQASFFPFEVLRFSSLERLGESGATHDSQSASRSGVEARVARNLTGGTSPMHDPVMADSGARPDWQACTTHAFLLDHCTSCTVFGAIVLFAMTIMARSFTTHLTSIVVHRVRFGPDSRESGPNPDTGLTGVRSEPGHRTHLTSLFLTFTTTFRIKTLSLSSVS